MRRETNIIASIIILSLGIFLVFGSLKTSYAEDPPDTITIKKLENLYGEVEFPHSDHFEYTDSCSDCHHHSGEKTISCQRCHKPFKVYKYSGSKRKNGLGLKGAYHGRCLKCHEEESGPTGCTDCHERRKKPTPNFSSEKE